MDDNTFANLTSYGGIFPALQIVRGSKLAEDDPAQALYNFAGQIGADMVVEFSEFDPCTVLEVAIWAILKAMDRCGDALARWLSDKHISPSSTLVSEFGIGLLFTTEHVAFFNGNAAAEHCKTRVDFSNDEASVEGYGSCEAVGEIVLNHRLLHLDRSEEHSSLDMLISAQSRAPKFTNSSGDDDVFRRELSDNVAKQFVGEQDRVGGLVGRQQVVVGGGAELVAEGVVR